MPTSPLHRTPQNYGQGKALFVPGPTNIPDSIRKHVDVPMEDHRAPDMPEFLHPLFSDLKTIFGTKTGRVFIFPGSGSGCWEAAIVNLLNSKDRVLICRNGQFSVLWADMCEKFGLDVDRFDIEWGKAQCVDMYAQRLAEDTDHKIKAVFMTHNETSTGVVSDIAGMRAALDAAGHPALLFVDGVSSIASMPMPMDDWGVDVAVSGSQKGFMLPAGLGMVGVSAKALERTGDMSRCYFSFDSMIALNDQGYFPYTPPMTLLRGLRASIDLLLGEGLEAVYARHKYLASGVRSAIAAWGLELCAKDPNAYSDTVSTIMLPDGVDGNALVRHCYERYGISFGAGLTNIAGRAFRIGHLGHLNELMLLQALAGAEMGMRDIGMNIVPGSGVAAAQEYYRAHG